MFSPVTLRNFLLIAAGALLFFWPMAQQAFASIVACAGCSCVSQQLNALASCTAIAQCYPELTLLTVNASIEYLCPGHTVANEATTTGYIGGYNIFATEYAQDLSTSRVCINQWALEQCNGYKTSGITSVDLACCSPPPPPPPSGGGGGGGCDPCNPSPCTGSKKRGGVAIPVYLSVCNPSPIIIDVGGQGFVLTSANGGVVFDISGDGYPIQMAWTASGAANAFLALPGADGLVHNGKQLFGNFTPQPPSNNPNGFAALAVYDDPKNGGNGDGIIDSRDAIFSALRLWIDANHDGISQPDELHTLPSLGVNSISLKYKASERTDQYGNVFRYRAQVNPGDATDTGRMAYDVFFSTIYQSGSKAILSASTPADANKCSVPVPTKGGMLSSTGSL